MNTFDRHDRSCRYTPSDVDRIVAETFVERVELHREIASTSDRALELAGGVEGDGPLLVLSEIQTAGRGRGTNRWWAAEGALTFSLVLPAAALRIPTARLPKIGLAAGLAVCEAVEPLAGGRFVRVKWPNDVYIDGRKVCGILVELRSAAQGTVVLGIGINVNNSLRQAPAELQTSAIALCEVAGRPLPLADVLVAVLDRLARRLGRIACKDDALEEDWAHRCLLTGREIEIDVGTRRIAGRCRGIDGDGALLIQTADEMHRCYAGMVEVSRELRVES